MKLLNSLLLLPVLVIGIAAPAMAQANISVLNEERVLRESAAGQHIAARMQEIAQEIDSELQALSQPIQQETERLNAETASMTQQAIQELSLIHL